jgi:hypothetical protein
MIGHPIDNDVHPGCVRSGDKVFEIVQRPKLGIHAVIVPHGVLAPQRALAVLDADRMNRHQPEDIRPQGFQAGQVLFRRPEGTFLGELPGVDLVEPRLLAPLRVPELDVRDRLIKV